MTHSEMDAYSNIATATEETELLLWPIQQPDTTYARRTERHADTDDFVQSLFVTHRCTQSPGTHTHTQVLVNGVRTPSELYSLRAHRTPRSCLNALCNYGMGVAIEAYLFFAVQSSTSILIGPIMQWGTLF